MIRQFLFVATNHKTKITTVTVGGNMGGTPDPFSYAFDDAFDVYGKPTVSLRWLGDPEAAGASIAEQKQVEVLRAEPDGLNNGQLFERVKGAKSSFDTAVRKLQKGNPPTIERIASGRPWKLRLDALKETA